MCHHLIGLLCTQCTTTSHAATPQRFCSLSAGRLLLQRLRRSQRSGCHHLDHCWAGHWLPHLCHCHCSDG